MEKLLVELDLQFIVFLLLLQTIRYMRRIDPSFFSCTFNVNITFENYLNTVNTLINSHAPLKKLSKKQVKFQQKPWITY